jgi:hypothetical protein
LAVVVVVVVGAVVDTECVRAGGTGKILSVYVYDSITIREKT